MPYLTIFIINKNVICIFICNGNVIVTINKEGKYTIKFWVSTADGNQSVVAKRVINVAKTSITLYREVETTPTVVPTTKDIEPVTTEPVTVAPTTKDETESEASTQAPTTKPIITEPVTIKPTTVVSTTKSVTTTASQKVKVGKTAIKKAVKQKKAKKAKISLKKVKKVSGYQVQISTSAKFVKKLTITKNIKKTSCTIKACHLLFPHSMEHYHLPSCHHLLPQQE